MYSYASKKINVNDNFYSFKKRKSSNEFYSARKKERFIVSFSHNFTTPQLYYSTASQLHILHLGSLLLIFGQLRHFTSSQLHDFTTPQLYV